MRRPQRLIAATVLIVIGLVLGTRAPAAPVQAVAPPPTTPSATVELGDLPSVPVGTAALNLSQPVSSAVPPVRPGVKPRIPGKKKPVATTPGF